MALTAANSNMAVGSYGQGYRSIYSVDYPPEYYPKYFQRYANGFLTYDMLTIAGNSFNIRNKDFFHLEEQAMDRLATVGSAGIATAAAGVNISFGLASTDYDTGTNGPLRVGDTILIPLTYCTAGTKVPHEYRVASIASSGTSQVYTCSPLTATSSISVAVPSGTKLIIGATKFARGSGQPVGKKSGDLKREHAIGLYKDTIELEGGHAGTRDYREQAGGFNVINTLQLKLERKLDRQLNHALLVSELNTNSVTETTQFSGDQNVLSGKGYWNWLDELAQEKTWASTFGITDFDATNLLMEAQGVLSGNIWFNAGTDLYRIVENGLLSYITTYSNGTDLMTSLGKLGVQFKEFSKGGYNYTITKSSDFSNPNTFGASAYNFTNSGFMVPMGESTIALNGLGKMSLPNLGIAYFSGNGEDRSRIIDTAAGMNGLGYQVVNQYDGTWLWALAECGLFAANVNQHVWVIPA